MMKTPSNFPKLTLVKLELGKVVGYDPMYHRPYTVQWDPATLGKLEDIINTSLVREIAPAQVSTLASRVLHPSPKIGEAVYIPRGWESDRWVFMLEVLSEPQQGPAIRYFFQGYSTHGGTLPSGLPDPSVEFIFNAFIAVNEDTQTVQQSAAVLSDLSTKQTRGFSPYMLRPSDVLCGLQMCQEGYDMDMVTDTRVMLSRGGALVSRILNIPTAYVAKLATSYCTGQAHRAFSCNAGDIIQHTDMYLNEPHLMENPFVWLLAKNRETALSNRFTLADLDTLQPGFLASRVAMLSTDTLPVRKRYTEAHKGAAWNRNTQNTWAASRLGQMVPALMAELGIEEIHFSVSGQGSMTDTPLVALTVQSTWSRLKTDIEQLKDVFSQRFIDEILLDLLHDHEGTYQFKVEANTLGESWFVVSFDGAGDEAFLVPSFCDSLFSPMATPQRKAYQDVVEDVHSVLLTLEHH